MTADLSAPLLRGGRRRVWIDARGGGFGHAMRGAALAQRLGAEGHEVTLGVSAGAGRHLPRNAGLRICEGTEAIANAEVLIVDTFAEGIDGAWNERSLRPFSWRVLCARYRRDGQPPIVAAYDEIWSPYCRDHDEWAGTLPRTRHLGLLARRPPTTWTAAATGWTVFDPGQRLDPVLGARLARMAAAEQQPLSMVTTLSSAVAAAKLLCIGAGYNTFYELLALPLDLRFLPLARRFDDQARRARLAGRAVDSLDSLSRWLHSPPALQTLSAGCYAPTADAAFARVA